MKYSDSDRRFELTGKYKGNFTIPVRDKKRERGIRIFITKRYKEIIKYGK